MKFIRKNRGITTVNRFMAAQLLVPNRKAYIKELLSGYLLG